MPPITVTYACQRCDLNFAVCAYPVVAATYTSPAEGGDIEPDVCPECGGSVDCDGVFQKAGEKLEDQLADKYEQQIQRRRDGE